MATITGLTAARMLAIEAACVVDGEVVGDDLILTRQDSSTINAGDVRGPAGPTGAAGSDLTVLSAQAILDVGQVGQIKAGRLLAASDFTDMGLSAPVALYPLSGTPDTSGNGRNLTNKGTVPFTGRGIVGGTNSAALFSGSATQALYFLDTGGADPFRIKTGSFGGWFKTAKAGVSQAIMGKYNSSDGQHAWLMQINANNVLEVQVTGTGLAANMVICQSFSVVADDRWHFAVGVVDGTSIKVYVDGVLEGIMHSATIAFGGSAPFNIGGLAANAGTNAINPFYGRIDETFVTADVLTEEQIRNLYCARVSHGLAALPKRASLRIRRRRKGAALVSGDFPSAPLRLYNFSAGALTDAGSNGVTLTTTGTPVAVAGADGSAGNGYSFDATGGTHLKGTDTGLPSGLSSRSYGCWLKYIAQTGTRAVMGWGASSASTAAQMILVTTDGINDGLLFARNIDQTIGGIFAGDNQWHFVVVTEDNAAIDGLKRKMYMDGKLVASGTTMTTFALGGADRFRIGVYPDAVGSSFRGQVDGAFVFNGILSAEEILALYNKGSLALGPSPKNAGDHIEAMSTSDLLCCFDTLEGQHQIDLAVA